MNTSERLNLEQNEIARCIGFALSAWSGLENNLTLLFQTLSEMKEERKALIVMASIINFDARMKIVNELMELWDWDQHDKEIWRLLASRIQRQQKRRNELAHFQLISFGGMKESDCKMAAVPFYTQSQAHTGIKRKLYAKDIFERYERFRQLAAALSWLTRRASQSPHDRRKSSEPADGLILQLQKQVDQNLEEDELPQKP